jgi:ElaB/YqjD/DUF883 family membrane-anchored ribosome-binding protein
MLKSVKGSARTLSEQASELVDEVTRAIKDETGEFFDDQKAKVASRIGSVGSMIEKAGRMLHAGKVDAVAEYVDTAADTADRASRYLEDHDVDQIAKDAGEFVKQHPAAVFGSALVLGLVLARFIKASQDE